jgi:carbamoyl-phosphate synthase large subunit
VLGPEMRSTGEVMGIADTFGESYSKSQIAAFGPLPKSGQVFISLAGKDKAAGVEPTRALAAMGFGLIATAGTSKYLADHGIFGERTAVDLIASGGVDLVINTPVGRGTRQDGWLIRTAAVQRSIPCITTIAGFNAAVSGIQSLQNNEFSVRPLQDWLALS